MPTHNCFQPNATIKYDEIAKILALAERYPLNHPPAIITYPNIQANYWAFYYIEALYDNYVLANPGSQFVAGRLATRGYAAYYDYIALDTNIPYPNNVFTLGQAFTEQSSQGPYIYVQISKTVPLRNGNYENQYHYAGGAVGLTDVSVNSPATYIESGPSDNLENSRNYHSYANSSIRNSQFVDLSVYLQPSHYYIYYSQYTPNPPTNFWTASDCDPVCKTLKVYDLGATTSLPEVASVGEASPYAENLGNTTTRDTLMTRVSDPNNTHPWCYDLPLIFNTAGALFDNCSGSPDYYWNIKWTHD